MTTRSTCLAFSALASLAAPSALAQDWNRSVESVELRHDPGEPVGTYDVVATLRILQGDNAPSNLDLSTETQLYVNGMLRGQTTTDVVAISDMPCAGQGCAPSVCGAINGGTPDETEMTCQAGFGICYCGVQIVVVEEIFGLAPGDDVEVVIGVPAGAVPEMFLPDDNLSIEFLGANYCLANDNSTGSPAVISAAGSASISHNDLVLQAGPLPAGVPGIFYYGPNALQNTFGEGFRRGGGSVSRFGVRFSDAQGVLSRAVDYANPPSPNGQITSGSTWRFQVWYRDPMGGPVGFNLSDGYMISFIP